VSGACGAAASGQRRRRGPSASPDSDHPVVAASQEERGRAPRSTQQHASIPPPPPRRILCGCAAGVSSACAGGSHWGRETCGPRPRGAAPRTGSRYADADEEGLSPAARPVGGGHATASHSPPSPLSPWSPPGAGGGGPADAAAPRARGPTTRWAGSGVAHVVPPLPLRPSSHGKRRGGSVRIRISCHHRERRVARNALVLYWSREVEVVLGHTPCPRFSSVSPVGLGWAHGDARPRNAIAYVVIRGGGKGALQICNACSRKCPPYL
jgi:hypothetical protein